MYLFALYTQYNICIKFLVQYLHRWWLMVSSGGARLLCWSQSVHMSRTLMRWERRLDITSDRPSYRWWRTPDNMNLTKPSLIWSHETTSGLLSCKYRFLKQCHSIYLHVTVSCLIFVRNKKFWDFVCHTRNFH